MARTKITVAGKLEYSPEEGLGGKEFQSCRSALPGLIPARIAGLPQ
jgi:hypothetical protein